jgi:hypothetical protein
MAHVDTVEKPETLTPVGSKDDDFFLSDNDEASSASLSSSSTIRELEEEAKPFKDRVGEVMKSKVIDIAVLILILIYAVIVFMSISFEDTVEEVETEVLILELVILCFFLIELMLKIYAFRIPFLKDGWNIFDIIIVIICFIMTCIQLADRDLIEASAVRFTGILRLLRIVVMFRKVNEMRKINEKQKVKSRIS